MNTVEEHDHPTNHQLGEEGMNIVSIHMMEVEGMDMVEESPSNHRPEVDMVEVEVVEREHEGVVLTRHWIGDGAERHQVAHREWEEPVKSGCSEGHATFASWDSNCSTCRRVEKRVDEMCEMSSNHGGVYRVVGDEI
jgi:hypothetical protein